MKLFHLVLRTPEKHFFEGDVESLTLLQSDGLRTFLADHEPCLGNIVGGVCKYVIAEQTVHFVTADGFFLVEKGRVIVNSSLIEYGTDYKQVIDELNSNSLALRSSYKKARQEYVKGRAEIARALSDKKPDID